MERPLELAGSIASLSGLSLAIAGLWRDEDYTPVLGGLFLLILALLLSALLRQSLRLKKASLVIEGRRLDCLNAENVSRKLNRDFRPRNVRHRVVFYPGKIVLEYSYSGVCVARDPKSAFLFNVGFDGTVDFSKLECYAFDLANDPARSTRILPSLVGPDGISKKLSVALLRPVSPDGLFDVHLYCCFPSGCDHGLEYFMSTLGYSRCIIDDYRIVLEFVSVKPKWMRIYNDNQAKMGLERTLAAARTVDNVIVYEDFLQGYPGDSSRVYFFQLEEGSEVKGGELP